MKKVFTIIAKNFKLLVRAKTSALVIFLGPLLLVSLLGMAYSNSSDYTPTVAVYSNEYTNLTYSLLDKLKAQKFDVTRYPNIEECTQAVKRGDAKACIQFPNNMKIEEGAANEIAFYVDYSQITLVWLMLDAMSTGVSEKSKEISKDLTTDVLNKMTAVEDNLRLEKAKFAQIVTDHGNLRASIVDVKGKVAALDIGVDFSGLDIAGGKSQADGVLAQYVSMRASVLNSIISALNKTTKIRSDLQNVKSNASGAVQSQIDSIIGELNSAELLMNSAKSTASSDLVLANASIISIKNNFDTISEKLTAAQSRIAGVKKSRDDLLVSFDTVTMAIDGISVKLGEAEKLIDEALAQISSVKIKNAAQIASPLTTKISPIVAPPSHFNSLFPTLLVLIIMTTGILFAAILVVSEKKSRSFFRNSITPTTFATFAVATYLTAFLVLLLQLLLFVSVSALFFKAQVLTNSADIAILLFLTMSLFILIGMLVGFLFRSEEIVTLAALTLMTLFLLFSNTVIPLESLPVALKGIASFNPFVISEGLLKQTVLFSLGIKTMAKQVFILAGYGSGMFVMLILLQNVLRRISFMHFWSFQFGEAKNAKVALTATKQPGLAGLQQADSQQVNAVLKAAKNAAAEQPKAAPATKPTELMTAYKPAPNTAENAPRFNVKKFFR
ncbi:ABC transporter permease [Candidatus Woesearchaeota archaeon]|nr:ABC transporter permease [Candidatus Woesearchaeota archaeon]